MKTPSDLIFEELASFAKTYQLNLGISELNQWAGRVFKRLEGRLITQKEAARLLGVSQDMVHHYRKDGLIQGTPKNPNALRLHWLYPLTDVLELRSLRARFQHK